MLEEETKPNFPEVKKGFRLRIAKRQDKKQIRNKIRIR